ncbi:sentrin-specific protease 6 isoform X1 [Pezoporus wallicus]|uniref:sentrin-specific protease 6 isoform X1 n=1 Tax=Pezoporus wallicus TaxID=35540 RepID=UPI00254F8CFF|nr:sentrin-specific protease 6 isoform X1 [Pezoporus wallicus]XP_057274842.1 sentrin-specific protease 6 isoform X1 [Pezoporus wallicus]XP_061316430.1 sentrin-specific protease 6 isoform X1 [Pezoporus flaviventris]XP_061316432.1 sentrin-specific protease 6 isoform X1 [Pezoporus flaviventris]
MMGNNKKLSENAQNVSCPVTVVHGRRFHHAHAQTAVVKTAAQSNLDRKERKEYPPQLQKVEADHIRLPRSQRVESIMENREESESESEPEIKRKVQQKRHCNSYQSDFTLSSATKKCLTQLKLLEQIDYSTNCPNCGRANEKQTKCRHCESASLQRVSRQTVSLSESVGPLSRSSIHQNSTGQKSSGTGFSTKKFYSSTVGKGPTDILLSSEVVGHSMLRQNGKVGLITGTKNPKITGSLRQRSTRPSELNDPIVLSSDDDEEEDSGSTRRMESISPRPADSARSSPAPSTGKVEAALKENSCGIEQRIGSITTDSEIAVTLPRKARMKDQFGNIVSNTPIKRRKVISQEILTETVPLSYQNSCESVILNCRSIRIGTLRRMVVEPVIFCLDYIKIRLESQEESESDIREINLKTSELTKCEWCSVRKLPVVFLQTVPSTCSSLREQLKMSKDNVWYECKGDSQEEQYIILIFETGLDPHANSIFEKIITDIGIRNNISDFFVKISFEEANGRLVAFTKCLEDNSKGSPSHRENKIKNVASESKMQQRNKQLPYFDDDEEIGEPHTVFIGPIEKLIVYPPPPAKGGISVTNEDLHCLNEGEFLNDVIIDFYLKYLVLEKLKKEDADRIHVFSSFFYKRLNQRERRNIHETSNLSIQQKRHGRVKTWTRHVDIFEKDFIFVPLNEAAHWFLAVICFPGLEKPKYEPNPHYHENAATQLKSPSSDGESNTPSPSPNELDAQNSPSKSTAKKMLTKKFNTALIDPNTETEDSESSCCRRSPCRGKSAFKKINQIDSDVEEPNTVESACHKLDHRTLDANGIQGEFTTASQSMDGLHKIRLNYSEDSADGSKLNEDELIDFSEDQDNQVYDSKLSKIKNRRLSDTLSRNYLVFTFESRTKKYFPKSAAICNGFQIEDSSDDGGLLDDNCNSEMGQWHLKPTICKQPCILLMDSLRGPSRSNVVKILREYLEVEWEVRKGNKRSFSKDVMKGSNPKVPQQNNFSDCGVYILQYVESFFENPILSFELPMNLTDWFPRPRMKTKREEIRKIILKLQEQQNKEKKGQKDASSMERSLQEKTEQLTNSSSD